ncbi:MAG: hypothetical protein GXO23_00945 [Crenarchaeota archaeon]|nr:hypothetical protein [Thermoproteota archaeon]
MASSKESKKERESKERETPSIGRPLPLEYLIVSSLRDKRGEMWYSELKERLKMYYPDITDSEILKALMRLELGSVIIVESVAKRDNPYYIRLAQ